MNLSILIPTIPSREKLLSELLIWLKPTNKTEILIFSDDCYHSIGAKRNYLLSESTGKFIVFIDDDDLVHENYCEIITNVIENENVDYIGYKMKRSFDGIAQTPEYHSIRYKECYKDTIASYRHISHTNPIKRAIAKSFRFPFITNGEDNQWCEKIYKSEMVKKEFFIDDYLYEQRYVSNKSFEHTFHSTKNNAQIPCLHRFMSEIKLV